MIFNRIGQSLSKTYGCRSIATFYWPRQHFHISVKHNLLRSNLLEPSAARGRKCRPIFGSSCCSSVQNYSSDSSNKSGVVRILRGFRDNWEEELVMPAPITGLYYLYKLTKMFDDKLTFFTFYTYVGAFGESYSTFIEVFRKADVHELDREWLLPEAQQDAQNILRSLPSGVLPTSMNTNIIMPIFMGYTVENADSSSFVDAAFCYPSMVVESRQRTLWHIVYTRKFGPGIRDGWVIKALALYLV